MGRPKGSKNKSKEVEVVQVEPPKTKPPTPKSSFSLQELADFLDKNITNEKIIEYYKKDARRVERPYKQRIVEAIFQTFGIDQTGHKIEEIK